jgi:nitrate/TMAO reductase-like tetraheme cytochrome c subunit
LRKSRVAVLALGALLGLAAVLVGLDRLTSSPALCMSCHEMGVRAHAWTESPHANVKCVSCHVPDRPWYAFPETLYSRGALVGRDVVKHFAATVSVVDTRPAGVAPMSDAVCEQCHDPNRKPTAGLGILIDHPKHAKRNGACVSCHITVAHPKESRGTAVSFMGMCFTCHGLEKGAKAPATCTLCHPADFKLRPETHTTGKWMKQHGKVKLADPKQCGMCHKQSFCDGCHGVQMPHPKGWAQRTGHPVAAKRDRDVCAKCHGGKLNMCTMCHHKSYDPAKGTWVQQHFNEVRDRGAAFCLQECHSPVTCANCHVKGLGAQ